MGIHRLNCIFDTNFVVTDDSCIHKDDVIEVFKRAGYDVTVRILVKFMSERGIHYVKDMRFGGRSEVRGGYFSKRKENIKLVYFYCPLNIKKSSRGDFLT